MTATASISTTTSEGGQTANNTRSAFIDITPSYDVTTAITGPATTAVGVLTTFSIATINNGPSVAPNVVQTVTGLPTNLTNVYVSNGGTYDAASGTVTFPALPTLASNGRAGNTISFTPTATNATGFTATAVVLANSDNTNDANPANNSVAATTLVVNAAPAATPSANLYTSITNPAASVAPNGTTTFTVTSGNQGPAAAATVAQRVTLPAGLSGVVVKNSAGTVLSGAYNATTGVVTFPDVNSLGSGSTATYTIDLLAPASGMIAAVATISAATADATVGNNIATADVTVTPATDVTVRLTGPDAAAAGSSVTYTVTTTNNGPATATKVTTSVTIPTGLTGVVVSGGGTYDAATGVVTFPATASLLNGSTVSNTITYTAPGVSSIANVASATAGTTDTALSNSTATITTAVSAVSDVTVAISGPATIVQGNQVDYVISTTNNGPSPASNVTTTVQLPVGLTLTAASTGFTYNAATGVLTFATIASQVVGSQGTVSNAIRFTAPTGVSQFNVAATVGVSGTTQEASYANNTASLSTTALAPTTVQTDLKIVVTPSTITPVAGQPLTLSIATTNLATSTGAATNVVQRVTIEAGLAVVSITNGGVYDPASGVITFPALSSLAAGATVNNVIVLTTPGATPLTVRGLVSGEQSDPDPTSNVNFQSLTVTPRADVATTVSGPATAQPGDLVTYSIATLNNGPSVAAGVVQTVTIPAGATNVLISGSGTRMGNTVTFPTIAAQVPGSNGQVLNTISFNAPADGSFTASYPVTGNVTTTTTQSATANDAFPFTTAKGNLVPVANAVANTRQGPVSNSAGPVFISALSGTDADGVNTIVTYTITTIPDAMKQGTIRLNGTAVTVNQVIDATDVAKLTFDPLGTFVGNAFFTYTATDNGNGVPANVLTSAPATYTLPVAQDVQSVYARPTTTKGGNANKYVAGDVLAYGIDPNAAQYNSAGLIYDPATGAAPATGTGTVSNGLLVAKISPADSTSLGGYGIRFARATGLFTVFNPALLPRAGITLPAITVTSIDLNGGVNTNSVTLITGANPLPVELTAFTATAKNLDALLAWHTAQEKNNDHFDVERSLNGQEYVKIGQVQGQGSKTSPTDYSLTDTGIGAKVSGLVYYRLRQVDTDGTATYSPVRSVSFSKVLTPAIALFPNPATATTQLDLTGLPTGRYQVSVLDATGRLVLSATLEAGLVHALDLNPIASGTYNVLVRGQNNGQPITLTKRLIKE